MSSSFLTQTNITYSSTNYDVVAPISMVFALIAVIIAIFMLILISITKQLHTITYLLISNTCISSILYCVIQCTNYIYLLFIKWDTNDQSCRWRGYFGYMSIASVIYSYLLQATSRYFFVVLSAKYRWLTSLRSHLVLIFIEWIIVLVIPLPSLMTKDIYFRPGFLCWVPKKFILHIFYTIIAYYLIPITLIIAIYISIYIRIHHSTNNVQIQRVGRRTNRDLEVFRNIIFLIGIYILGAIPSMFYLITDIELFYSLGIVSVSFTVTIEKVISISFDKEIRKNLKKFLCHTTAQITPIPNNNIAVDK